MVGAATLTMKTSSRAMNWAVRMMPRSRPAGGRRAVPVRPATGVLSVECVMSMSLRPARYP
jgi:hypothetical protein